MLETKAKRLLDLGLVKKLKTDSKNTHFTVESSDINKRVCTTCGAVIEIKFVPMMEDENAEYPKFVQCPVDEGTMKRPIYDVQHLEDKNEWSCTCLYQVLKTDMKKHCSHIMACKLMEEESAAVITSPRTPVEALAGGETSSSRVVQPSVPAPSISKDTV